MAQFATLKMSIYIDLTKEFNKGGLRAILSSGQAVVMHRLAMMSKDGDWIIKEQQSALNHILEILRSHRAKYRFGAPLDLRWLSNGWSSHFEFKLDGLRIRTDFFSRPARISEAERQRIWEEMESKAIPYLDKPDLIKVKMTQREKDYPIIGELARGIKDPEMQMRFSRSARDLIRLSSGNQSIARSVAEVRPLIQHAIKGDRDALESDLDRERRLLIREDEERMERYSIASQEWKDAWPDLQNRIIGKDLYDSHDIIKEAANELLPQNVS